MNPTRESAVRICVPYPELLGTYGDGGNGVVLAQRLRWRGFAAELVSPSLDQPLPQDCALYLLGGGEDAPQTLATDRLRESDLAGIVERGAVVLAICAGLQLVGRSFTDATGATVAGLGLLDCTTRPKGSRMIGELVVEPTAFALPRLTGFENHGGITELGPGAVPLGRVLSGSGNGISGVEGVVQGRVVGTYLHGPCLARNPGLADLLLSWVVGPELAPLDDAIVDTLRAERLEAALGRRA
jgi:CobQ-like glutamine amidotransferase family enzyme